MFKKLIGLSLSITLVLSPLVSAHATTNSCTQPGKSNNKNQICWGATGKLSWQTLPDFNKLIDQATKLTKLPKTLNPPLLKVSSSRKSWFDQTCTTDFPSTELFQCWGGDSNSKRTIILYGDSHASMWMTALDEIGKVQGFKVLLLAKLACPILQKTIWSYQLNEPFTECDEWNQKALNLIKSIQGKMPDSKLVLLDIYYPTNIKFAQYKPVIEEWNKLISDFASANNLQVIKTSELLIEPSDFSLNIEPSETGGEKIADNILLY